MTEDSQNGSPKQSVMRQEIVPRVLKAGKFFGSILVWFLYFSWAWSLLTFWAGKDIFNPGALTVRELWEFWSQAVTFIVLIAVIRLVQLAADWAVLIPHEARARGINTKDADFSDDLKKYAVKRLVPEGIALVILIAVTILSGKFPPAGMEPIGSAFRFG